MTDDKLKKKVRMDRGRVELITRFFCAECGGALDISYDDVVRSSAIDGDPTGAHVRYNPISIHPCRSCIDKHLRPARQLAEAINSLTGSDQNTEG